MDAGVSRGAITEVSDIVYSRAPDVVWRVGPDRVLVRRIGEHGENAAVDLLGEAAFIWIALDEPGTLQQLCRRLKNADTANADTASVAFKAIGPLTAGGWLSQC
jgi:hypothetical protein